MEPFPWWNEEHRKFAADIGKFVDEVTPRDEEAKWKREFLWDINVRGGQ
jgi:DNA polymerase sigma